MVTEVERAERPGNERNEPAARRTQPARLGGARADFVASLGRKVNDARGVLASVGELRGARGEKGPREELRRRLHAIGASARLLRFDEMARALGEAEAALDAASERGSVSDDDVRLIAQVLDDLPALAWGEPTARDKAASEPPPRADVRSALVVGPAMLAEALTEDDETTYAALFECERTDDAQAAIGMARALAPDVMLIDAEVDSAAELVEALLDDPLTEPVPIVVVGAFRAPEQAGRFIALGVAKALTKPVTTEALRRACEDAIEQRQGVTMRVTLGEPTLEQLGDRLAEEVRRAIVEAVDKGARGVRVPLGEGTEVLGAVWGAIARVREVVTTRTDGAVRFTAAGPEGTIAVAPWLLPDLPGTDRGALTNRGRGAAADVRLHGRRVVVADDDPGVTWFIADLLRTAGCIVHEALDGAQALDLCYRVAPELVVSDILMPGLDGFALARQLKRDVALRDTPVILLSWKEDLLQRVRELGASAAAYLRKESDSRAIVARVRECLRPRARVEARLREGGEVRGRLDGLTVRSLLEIACAIRPNARITVRDASFLYEIEVRSGAPRKITRTAGDGSFVHGEAVLGGLLGVGAGRFTVAASTGHVAQSDADLEGSLEQQLRRPLALARAATSVTTGARTMMLEQVALDVDAVEAYVASTPEPARSIVLRLADGASPRAMLLAGEAAPPLMEDVLADLAQRGAIVGARSAGVDALGPALDALIAAQEAPLKVTRTKPPPRVDVAPRGQIARVEPARSEPRVVAEAPHDVIHETFTISDTPPPPPAEPQDITPSSLADAVMRELSDAPSDARSSNPPPIVEPAELRPRTSSAPSFNVRAAEPIPSLPPDAMVPDDASDASEERAPSAANADDALAKDDLAKDDFPSIFGDPTEVDAPVESRVEPSAPLRSAPLPSAPLRSVPIEIDCAPESDGRRHTPLSSVASHHEPGDAIPLRTIRWPYVGIGALAAVVAIAMTVAKPSAPPAAASEALAEPPATPATGVPVPSDTSGVAYGEIPPGLDVAAGQGLLEITAPVDATVRVDGAPRGSGPKVRVPVSAGPHEVRVLAAEAEHAPPQVRLIEVRAGVAARIDLTRP